MSEQEIILNLLDELLEYQFNVRTTGIQGRLLALNTEQDSYIIDDAYHRTLSALIKCGEIIQNDFDQQLILAKVIVRGIPSLPCIIMCRFDEDRAYLNAYAKEFPQTPGIPLKAIQMIKKHL